MFYSSPQYGGKPCIGKSIEAAICNLQVMKAFSEKYFHFLCASLTVNIERLKGIQYFPCHQQGD